jgi:hypothetical protein
MNPLNIPELLLHIFHLGSELDLDDDHGSPPSLPFGDSRARSLKPFFRSIAQVNKNWRQMVLCVPSFWVTKVSFRWSSWEETDTGFAGTVTGMGVSYFSPPEQYDDAEELLNDSNGSDLDFSMFCSQVDQSISPYDSESSSVLGKFSQWMDTHIFSACDRVRQFSFFYVEIALLETISKRCFMCSWPRLQILILEATGQVALFSGALNAPRLSFASFANVEWIGNKFGLANSSISALHVEHDPENTSVTDFELSTVTAYLTPSLLSSLTELKLIFRNPNQQEHVIGDLPPSLPFARLKTMSLTLFTAENIWHLLKRTDAPLLTALYLKTEYRTTSGIPSECFPQRFPLLEDMGFSLMTPPWAAVFMRLLPTQHNRLSTLSLDLYNQIPGDNISQGFDATVLEKFFPHPTELPNLQNLSLNLGTTDAWFFTIFDLGAATGHLVLDYCYQETRLTKSGPLRFPNVTKVTVGHRKYLAHVAIPALRHLVFDFSNDHGSDDSFSVRAREKRNPVVSDSPLIPRDSDIPLRKLEILEIGWDSISHLKLFVPFIHVHTLVISAKHLFQSNMRSIPEILKGVEAGAFISGPVLPNLHTLGLSFEDPEYYYPSLEPESNSHDYELGLRIAQAFVNRRLDEGNPIRTLRIFGFLPKAVQYGPDLFGLRDSSGAKIEFERRKDDFAKRLRNPY